jgi:hypothetical protein
MIFVLAIKGWDRRPHCFIEISNSKLLSLNLLCNWRQNAKRARAVANSSYRFFTLKIQHVIGVMLNPATDAARPIDAGRSAMNGSILDAAQGAANRSGFF